jgi:putative phosphonate metabolism protein
MSAARYAIYFVPRAESRLYRFGAAALGYDCYSGGDVASYCNGALAAATWHQLTAEPRTYGFHATLKAPFNLRRDVSEAELVDALVQFGRRHRAPKVFAASLGILGGFAALTPSAPAPELDALADLCVRDFDRFRAPMTDAERTRRLKQPLSDRQRAYLDHWGYPYVLDEFRFHMTLTGRLEPECQNAAIALLRQQVAAHDFDSWILVDQIALLRQDDSSRFRMLHAAPLVTTDANLGDGARALGV